VISVLETDKYGSVGYEVVLRMRGSLKGYSARNIPTVNSVRHENSVLKKEGSCVVKWWGALKAENPVS